MAFQYKDRGKEAVQERANQQGGMYDSYTRDGIPTLSLKEGNHLIRILPPTWEDARHFGIDIYVHYGVGADNNTYLCLDKMKGEKCPICEEYDRAKRGRDEEYANSLKPSKRVLVYVIDRDNEKEGPQLWPMSWTIDRQIAALCTDARSGEVLVIDHPEKGYDVEFNRKGTGIKTKYEGMKVARNPSYLAQDTRDEDDWLDFVTKNPLPDVLVYRDYDYLAKMLSGGAKKDADRDSDTPRTRSSAREESRDSRSDDRPRRGEPEPTRERVRDTEEPRGRASEDRPRRDREEPPARSREEAPRERVREADPPSRREAPREEPRTREAEPPARRRIEEPDAGQPPARRQLDEPPARRDAPRDEPRRDAEPPRRRAVARDEGNDDNE